MTVNVQPVNCWLGECEITCIEYNSVARLENTVGPGGSSHRPVARSAYSQGIQAQGSGAYPTRCTC